MERLKALGQRAVEKVSVATQKLNRAVESAGSTFRMHTGAMDIVVVVTPDGGLRSTDWHVQIGRDAQAAVGSGVRVRVFLNGRPQDQLQMEVAPDGRCFFPGTGAPAEMATSSGCERDPHEQQLQLHPRGESDSTGHGMSLQPSAAVLASLNGMEMGRNEVRYEVTTQTSLLEATVSLFLWEHGDQVVVLHVETAILRRAALAKGAQTLSRGKHSGQSLGWDSPWSYVCELMVYLDTAGYRLVLLTSTPITWSEHVRRRLASLRGHAGRRDEDDDVLRVPAAALLSTQHCSLSHAVSVMVAAAGTFQTDALASVLSVFGCDSGDVAGAPALLKHMGETSGNEAERGSAGEARCGVPKVAGHIGAFGAAAILHHLAPAPFASNRVGVKDSAAPVAGARKREPAPEMKRPAGSGIHRGGGVLAGAFGDGEVDARVYQKAGVRASHILCVSPEVWIHAHAHFHDIAIAHPMLSVDSMRVSLVSFSACLLHPPLPTPPARARMRQCMRVCVCLERALDVLARVSAVCACPCVYTHTHTHTHTHTAYQHTYVHRGVCAQ